MANGMQIASGFDLKSKTPIDLRFSFPTMAEMKTFPETSLYDGIKSYCAADGKTYEWKGSNAVDQTTGKWREFGGGGGIQIPSKTKAELEEMISEGTIVMDNYYYCSTEKCLYRGTVKIGGADIDDDGDPDAKKVWSSQKTSGEIAKARIVDVADRAAYE